MKSISIFKDYSTENFNIANNLIFNCFYEVKFERVFACFWDNDCNIKCFRLINEGKNAFFNIDIDKILYFAQKVDCKNIAIASNHLFLQNRDIKIINKEIETVSKIKSKLKENNLNLCDIILYHKNNLYTTFSEINFI